MLAKKGCSNGRAARLAAAGRCAWLVALTMFGTAAVAAADAPKFGKAGLQWRDPALETDAAEVLAAPPATKIAVKTPPAARQVAAKNHRSGEPRVLPAAAAEPLPKSVLRPAAPPQLDRKTRGVVLQSPSKIDKDVFEEDPAEPKSAKTAEPPVLEEDEDAPVVPRLPPAPRHRPDAGAPDDDLLPPGGALDNPYTSISPQNVDCDAYRQQARKKLAELKKYDISKISLDIAIRYRFDDNGVLTEQPAVEGLDYPCTTGLGDEVFVPRNWTPLCYEWKASCLCHKPVYFEETEVERYGHSFNPLLQPAVHAIHFFGTIPILPYKMGLTPPDECLYALGYYRPGDCAPYMLPPLLPLSGRAGAFEAAAWTATAFIIP